MAGADSPTGADDAGVFDATVRDGVCRLACPGFRVLSTGFDGGVRDADAVHNVTVPEGWDDGGRRDLAAYVDERVAAAGFPERPDAPALLTGVDQTHARSARIGPVEVVATAGLSNPAALPVDGAVSARAPPSVGDPDTAPRHDGTVNLVVGTTRDLEPGALANLVAVAAAAKAATLLSAAGVPDTTSDAVVVASDPAGDPAAFSGAATAVGAAARACVRDAVLASLRSRYGPETDASIPDSVGDAAYGVTTDERAAVSPLEAGDTEH
ncbi:adenosylcobinamide amidohydrolase CbiZ [Haloparvum alkalitolerans]|uniref:adenosylcobinamide amidohydrolase n=1 Tax=Haloparvum alkalitolerans TaxID=1042953 RepID=UPI003CF17218